MGGKPANRGLGGVVCGSRPAERGSGEGPVGLDPQRGGLGGGSVGLEPQRGGLGGGSVGLDPQTGGLGGDSVGLDPQGWGQTRKIVSYQKKHWLSFLFWFDEFDLYKCKVLIVFCWFSNAQCPVSSDSRRSEASACFDGSTDVGESSHHRGEDVGTSELPLS